MTRRLDRVERGREGYGVTLIVDPATGDRLKRDEYGQLLRYASDLELALAGTALTGEFERCDGEFPERLAAMSPTQRGSFFVALHHRWHAKRREGNNELRDFTEADWDEVVTMSLRLDPVEVVA